MGKGIVFYKRGNKNKIKEVYKTLKTKNNNKIN